MNVGSSSLSFPSDSDSLSWSIFVFGSIATLMTGSGKIMGSRRSGWAGSHRVSPVLVFFIPTAAMMSPVQASCRSTLWFACIRSIRPMRSFWPCVELRTKEPVGRVPE